MLFERERFEKKLPKPAGWLEHVYRYCEFVDMDIQGDPVDSVFVSCSIEHCSWYWGMFCCALFVNVHFVGCTFRGTSFNSGKFVDCDFVDCVFTEDNLGRECSFDDTSWYGCTQTRCPGLEGEFRSKATPAQRRVAKYGHGKG
ncbi:MAG TPA: pentapeptide repeat-containing protein [Telluria sp.]|jgi:hypothetical protein